MGSVRSLVFSAELAFAAGSEALDTAPALLLGDAHFLRFSGRRRGAPLLPRLQRFGDQEPEPFEGRFLVPGLAPVALADHTEDPARANPGSEGRLEACTLLRGEGGGIVDRPPRLDPRLELVHVLPAGT